MFGVWSHLLNLERNVSPYTFYSNKVLTHASVLCNPNPNCFCPCIHLTGVSVAGLS